MTIRVLVVEDDFRVAKLHAALVDGVEQMHVVGVAHTAAEAVTIAAAEHPDLVLLDEYLPDAHGSTLMGRLEAATIVISADDDVRAIRRAVLGGAINVVLKPFAPAVLVGRLEAFVRFWDATDGPGRTDQRGADRTLAMLRDGDAPSGALPKGRSAVTADAIRDALRSATNALTAADVAAATGVSRATAQRYLSDLTAAGRAELSLRYGSTGRPEHRYTWRG